MESNIKYFCIKIILICWQHFVNAVPPDYCLQPLNTSDCNGPPTLVFYYYKPGSRCELGTWKGCPTNNKFDDEYLCSHYCIFRFIREEPAPHTDIDFSDQCFKTIKQNTCKDSNQNVAYTFNDDHQECVPIVWGSCKSPNIFKEKEICESTCLINWQDEIKNLTEDEVMEIDKLLDNVTSNATNDTTSDGNKHLKLKDDETTPMAVLKVSDGSKDDTQNSTEVAAAPTTVMTADKPDSDNSATEKPATEKPATEKPATKKPATEKPATEKPATEKPATEKPATEKPATEKPEQTTTVKPTTTFRSRGTVRDVVLPDDP